MGCSLVYLVFVCLRCGAVRYAKAGQKSALCFGCGYRVTIDSTKIRILFKTRDREKAMEAVQGYKMRLGKR